MDNTVNNGQQQNKQKENDLTTITNVKTIAKIGILSAVSALLMLLKVPLFFAPSFYKIDFSEVTVLLGAFSMGPVAGIIIEAVKVLLNFAMDGTVTAGVGELANFLIGCSFIVPAAVIYKRKKTKKNALLGLIAGVVSMVIFSALMNYFVLLPAYAAAYGTSIDNIVAMGSKVNPAITNIRLLILLATAPFNLLKGGLSAIITFFVYKKLSGLLHR